MLALILVEKQPFVPESLKETAQVQYVLVFVHASHNQVVHVDEASERHITQELMNVSLEALVRVI